MIDLPATPRQVTFVRAIACAMGMDDNALSDETNGLYGKGLGEINRREASDLIDRLQVRRGAVDPKNERTIRP